MAYVAVLEWTLKCTHGPKIGTWSGYQNPRNHERQFVRGIIPESLCSAKVNKNEGEPFYRITLHPVNSHTLPPIDLLIAKDI